MRTTVTRRPPRKLSPIQNALRLDRIESAKRLREKTSAAKKKYSYDWRDYTRPGRIYTRVETIEPTTAAGTTEYVLRPEPGWEWICPNCKTWSLITEAMKGYERQFGKLVLVCDVLKEWEQLAQQTVRGGFKAPVKPTAAMAGCTNCKFRPGDPE